MGGLFSKRKSKTDGPGKGPAEGTGAAAEETFFESGDAQWPDPSTFPHWYHGELDAETAEGYLAQNDGLEEVGRFLVRKDPGLTEADGRFVISVVFKGMATHHLLEQAHPGAAFTLNHSSTDDDITNLEKAIRYLYEEHANWPLKLSAAFFTSELSDGDGADGPPKINRLGSIKLTKKEQSSEGGELTGLLGARRNSIKAAAIKAEDEYAAVVKAAAEAEAAEELAKNPVPDAKSGDEDGSEENDGADGVGEEDTGFGGDLADAAAEDEAERAAEALETAKQKALRRSNAYDSLVKSNVQVVKTIEVEEDTFAYVPEGEVSSVMQQFLKAEEEARAEQAREKEQRTPRYSFKAKAKAKQVDPGPSPASLAPSVPEGEMQSDDPDWLVTSEGIVEMPDTGFAPTPGTVGAGSEDRREWYHPSISKEDAEELIARDGGLGQQGKFLVRATASNFIITVVYQGMATHHILSEQGNGLPFKVNGAPASDGCTTLELVVAFLRNENPNWPLGLTIGVAPEEPESQAAAVPPPAEAWGAAAFAGAGDDSDDEPAPVAERAPDIDTDVAAAADVVDSAPPATDESAAAVPVALDDDGEVANGEAATEAREKEDAFLAEIAETARLAKETLAADEAAAAANVAGDAGQVADDDSKEAAWYHGVILKSAAEVLLASDDGFSDQGRFLVRKKKDDDKQEYILSVVFEGQPSHHLLEQAHADSPYAINREPMKDDTTTLSAAIAYLRTERPPSWPLKLTTAVKPA